MNITTFESPEDARDLLFQEMPVITTHLLDAVQPGVPNFYEGDDPIYVSSGDRVNPRLEFVIRRVEVDNTPGVRVEIPNIEAAIDYFTRLNKNNMIDESSVSIAYRGEKLQELSQTDPNEWQKRAQKFMVVETFIRGWLQSFIDGKREWSPYANAQEYRAAMMDENNPPPTAPKIFF